MSRVCVLQFTALPLSTVVQPEKQATFEYSFIPAEPMAGRPFGLVIELHYQDSNVSARSELRGTSPIHKAQCY